MVRDVFPIERGNGNRYVDFLPIVFVVGSIVLAVSVFKLGVWLFVEQKAAVKPTDSADAQARG